MTDDSNDPDAASMLPTGGSKAVGDSYIVPSSSRSRALAGTERHGLFVGPAEEPDRFELVGVGLQGGEGITWRAHYAGQLSGPVPFAVKQLLPPAGAPTHWPTEMDEKRWRDHRFILQSIRSDHLVRLVDIFFGAAPHRRGSFDNRPTEVEYRVPYAVMDWIQGQTLADVVHAGGLDLFRRLQLIRQLAEAVETLHSNTRTSGNPMLHRDIKPENCIVHPERGLVLVDFGTLRQIHDGEDEFGMHTHGYAAPEVLSDPAAARSVPSDRYSLGAVASFCITGQSPAAATDALGAQSRRGEILVAAERASAADPDRLATLVTIMLDPDPDQRPSRSLLWADDLLAAGSPRSVPRRRSGKYPVLLLGACGLAAAVASTFLIPPDGKPIQPADSRSATSASPVLAAGLRQLPTFTAGSVRANYETAFARASVDWPTGRSATAETSLNAGYVVHALAGSRGSTQTYTAPTTNTFTDETITSTATIVSGQGWWGVWCRGVDDLASARYEFRLSHAGAVSITDSEGRGTGWHYVEGLDVAEPTVLSARCADMPGAPVELTLAVNGRTVLTYEAQGELLGPGFSGLEVGTFDDVKGPLLTARFSQFATGKSS